MAQNHIIPGKLLFEEDQQAIANVDVYIFGDPSFKARSNIKGVFFLKIPNHLLEQDSIRIVIKFDDLHQPTGYMNIKKDTAMIMLPRLLDLDYTNFIVKENAAGDYQDLNRLNPIDPEILNDLDLVKKTLIKLNGKDYYIQEESLLTGLNLDQYSLRELTNVFQNLDNNFQKKHSKVIDSFEKIQSELNETLLLSPSQIKKLRNELDSLEKELIAIKHEFKAKDTQYRVLVQRAQEEIDKLQELLATDSRFVRIHKYLYYSMISILSLLFLSLLVFLYMFLYLRKKRRELMQRNHTIDEQNQEILVINEALATQRDQLEHQSEKLKNYLEEIHHRVKNHLQRTSSLLDLSMSSGHPTEQTIENIRGRIYSMALIHKKLQNTENLDQVNLKEYIEDLVTSISATLTPPDKEIQCTTQIMPLFLDISTATDLGLIINELVTNAYKYAFEGRTAGKIEVIILRKAGKHYQLLIKDDGLGLPKEINIENTDTLGLSLTRDLAERLDGKVELETNHGTIFTIFFRPKTLNVIATEN